MPAQTRVGDIGIGICPCHKSPKRYITTFSTGAPSVLTNNLVSCIVGTIGVSSCGHPTVAHTGSPDVFHENSPAHRINDTGANCGPYVVVTGSPDVFINEPASAAPPAPLPVGAGKFEALLASYQPSASPTQIVQSMNEDDPNTNYTHVERGYLNDQGVNPDTPGAPSGGVANIQTPPPASGKPVNCFNNTIIAPSTRLSPNFTLNQMTNTVVSRATLQDITHPTYGPLTKQQILCNLQHLCINVLEPLRAKYGTKMALNSILRNPGEGGSQHYAGMAVDLQFLSEYNTNSYKTRSYMDRVQELLALVPYDQFILEYGSAGPIFHISYNPNGNRPVGTSFKLATRLSLVNRPGSFVNGIHFLPS